MPLREVMSETSLSKPVLYRMMRAGDFPRQVPLSPRRVAWVRGEVEAWKRAKQDAREAA
ncbi:AlpA family phage regulatory protein [Sphingomonas gilva]|uniref:AlpA family phage regulatory protein n=2 Tax=Sphingomonas gilva TaxID=2305907 RepID=A0A396RTH0_9SPHN|nr:AlpA family phage regulatory protein [Sphingomonas gilva]